MLSKVLMICGFLMGIFGTFQAQGQIEAAPIHEDITQGMVIESVYSTQFGKISEIDFPGWDTTNNPVSSPVKDADNKEIMKFENLGFQPFDLKTPIDVSAATHLNIDIYPSEATSTVNIRLIDWSGAERKSIYKINEPLKKNVWNTLVIPLSDFEQIETTLPLENFEHINIVQIANDITTITAYVDNIFFYKENIEGAFPAAETPKLSASDVVNFYSTKYGTNANNLSFLEQQWGGTTTKETEEDSSGNSILKFLNFNSIPIQYDPNSHVLPINEMNRLRMSIYPDKNIDEFQLKLILYKNPENKEVFSEIEKLKADQWNQITFDISDFYNAADGKISVIELKGGDGNTTLYVDHIYFFSDVETPPVPEIIPPAKIPELHKDNVVNFYSTKYGTTVDVDYPSWGQKTKKSSINDTSGKSILKFEDFDNMPIQYNLNDQILSIAGKNRLHIAVYPNKAITDFKVTLFLYEDIENRPPGALPKVETTMEGHSLNVNQWNEVIFDISEYYNEANGKVSSIRLDGGNGETLYVDHIYFYNSEYTPPAEGDPAFPAYTPPARKDTDVLPVFGYSYNVNDMDYDETGITTQVSTINFGGDKKVLKLTDTDRLPIKFTKDVNRMETLHIDIYSKETDKVSVFLKDNEGNEKAYPLENLIKEEWNRIDIPLTFFDNVDLAKLQEVGIKDGDAKTFFIDNIYFYKNQEKQTAMDIHALNKALGKGINLGTIWENPVTPWEDGFLDIAKNSGFDHVRMPIRWDDLDENISRSLKQAPYNIDESFLLEIKRIVDLAIDKGLRIIINMHDYKPLYEDPQTHQDRFLSMWGQIGEFFQNYHPSQLLFEPLNEPQGNLDADKWNALLVKSLEKIREKNLNRATLIGTADWGGVGELKNLVLPDDPNLILTIHYYEPFNFTHQGQEWMENSPPAGAKWNDTQSERDAVDEHFAQIEAYRKDHGNIPVHIGEYGAFYPGDIDSRVLWATYISNRIQDSGYSFAYWDFHFYMDNGGIFAQSIQDAILKNKIPAKPAKEFATLPVETLYDANNLGSYSWDLSRVYEDASANGTTNANGFEMTITKGGSSSWNIQPALKEFDLEKDKTYQVTFKVKTNVDNKFEFNSYMSLDSNSPVIYGSQSFTTGAEEQSVSFFFKYTYEKKPDDPQSRLAFDMGGKTGTTPVTVTISDVTIKEVSTFIPAAVKPELNNDKVLSVYSSYYTDNLSTTTYPAGSSTEKSNVKDDERGEVILLNDFSSQTIELGTTLATADRKNLCLSVYPGSFLDLVVIAREGSTSQAYTYTLRPHDWNKLDIDLTDFLSKTGGKISQITLSGGTGEGRKLYLDHIFFYLNSGSTDPEEPTVPATEAQEPTPSEEKVISIFSDPYNDISSTFDQLEGQTTKVQVVVIGNDSVWRLTTPNVLSINVGNLDVTRMQSFHLDVWTAQTERFRIYLSDGIVESQVIELLSIGQKWNRIDISLSSFLNVLRNSATVDLGNLRSIRLETDTRNTFYLDNLYFSTDEATGNTITESNNVTIKVIYNSLFIESLKDIRSIAIFNTSGRVVMRKQINRPDTTLDLSSFDSGVYILQVIGNDGEIKIFKFIKK